MDKVYYYLLNETDLKKDDTVVAGISGGPDSMVLLDLLLKLKKAKKINIVVVHINHNVREEADIEENYVKDFSISKNLIFESMKIEKISDDNFENEARTIRYNFFDNICKKYNAKYLMTAHHGDDLIETILMRIVRGSTLKGYSGFSKVVKKDNYTIIRPLISVTKDEILKYAIDNDIKYFVDKTNMLDIHTRNRYRKYALPFLKEENANVHEKFLKFSETLLLYSDYIDKIVNNTKSKVFINGELNVEEFLKLDYLIQIKIIYSILEKIYQDDLFIINNTHVKLILDLISKDKAQSTIHLPNNIKAIKSYNFVTFGIDLDNNDKYEIEINDKINLNNGKNLEVLDKDVDDKSNNIIKLNTNEVALPLYVRTRREGDKIEVKGLKGHKKVKDIFIDSKIKNKDRDNWPIVCDAKDNIIWIPGLKKSKYDRSKTGNYNYIVKYY